MDKSELLENLYMARALYSCWKTNESVKQKFIQEKQSKEQSLKSSIQKYNQQYNVEIKVLPNINWLYLIVPILLGAAAYGILVRKYAR